MVYSNGYSRLKNNISSRRKVKYDIKSSTLELTSNQRELGKKQ